MPQIWTEMVTENGEKIAKKWPKWPSQGQKWLIMVWNIKANGPNEARNTNTKLTDQKWENIDEKWETFQKLHKVAIKMAKYCLKWSNNIFPNIWYFKQFLFYAPTKIPLSKWAKPIGQSKKIANSQI